MDTKGYNDIRAQVEAFVWRGYSEDDWKDIENIVGISDSRLVDVDIDDESLRITTIEGITIASIGDYVVCDIEGEFERYSPQVFHETYEPSSQAGNNKAGNGLGSE